MSYILLRRRSGSTITVLLTSIIRRSSTLTRGSKRFPVGRPPKQEQLKPKRKKNIGYNIKNTGNQPNAKSHEQDH